MNTLIVYWGELWRHAVAGLHDHPSCAHSPGEMAAFERSLKRRLPRAMAGLVVS